MRKIFAILILCAPFFLIAQKKAINYLNQMPPGMQATLFSPGVMSSNFHEHSSPAFSPDGKKVVWTVLSKDWKASLYEMNFEKGKWTSPQIAAFVDTTKDHYYPSFSVDGKQLYFSSRRVLPNGKYPKDMRIWVVDNTQTGWKNPKPLDNFPSTEEEYAFSVSKKGDIYFSYMKEEGKIFDIGYAPKEGSKFGKTQVLSNNINTTSPEDGPFIAADGSYLIFESVREGEVNMDLFISFKTKKGWSKAINMGSKVNTKAGERFAKVSPDGKYLFFGSNRKDENNLDIYWIDAKVIDELKKLVNNP